MLPVHASSGPLLLRRASTKQALPESADGRDRINFLPGQARPGLLTVLLLVLPLAATAATAAAAHGAVAAAAPLHFTAVVALAADHTA